MTSLQYWLNYQKSFGLAPEVILKINFSSLTKIQNKLYQFKSGNMKL